MIRTDIDYLKKFEKVGLDFVMALFWRLFLIQFTASAVVFWICLDLLKLQDLFSNSEILFFIISVPLFVISIFASLKLLSGKYFRDKKRGQTAAIKFKDGSNNKSENRIIFDCSIFFTFFAYLFAIIFGFLIYFIAAFSGLDSLYQAGPLAAGCGSFMLVSYWFVFYRPREGSFMIFEEISAD
jgi:hypothetical protein